MRMPATSSKKDNKKNNSRQANKARLVAYLSSVKAEDVFPEKNKKAADNLKKAGLIKE